MELSKTEEQLMELIWQKEKVFLKDLIDHYPDPKPATTTIATLLKRMQDKGFVGYTLFGNSRQYYPLVKKADYFSKHVKGIIKNYFGNSAVQFASFFTTASNLSTAELEDLKKIIDQEIKKERKMILYLVKLIGCSGLLLLAYHLLLEKEKMHHFNRFYLLFSMVVSFVIPVITLPIQAKLLPPAETLTALDYTVFNAPVVMDNNTPQLQRLITSESKNWWPQLLLYFYLAVSLILLFRFVKNLLAIAAITRQNPTLAYSNATLVLTNNRMVPHSFFRYVFLFKTDYETNAIKQEILQHELTHVHQKHSLDILLMELLLIIFWFNPVLYLYRKAIRLNHEFLADDTVIEAFKNPVNYQQLLLLSASQPGSILPTSPFNYSITKKRLIMMTKNRSSKIALAKQITLLPFVAALVLLFSTKVIAQQNTEKPELPQDTTLTKGKIQSRKNADTTTSSWNRLFSAGSTNEGVTTDLLEEYENIIKKYETEGKWWHTFIKRVSDQDRNRLETIFKQMNVEQQGKQFLIFMKPMGPLPRSVPTTEQLQLWKNAKIYGVWIDAKRVPNVSLNKYVNTDFAQVFVSKLTKVAVNYGKHFYQVDLMTSKYYQDYYDRTMANKRTHIGFSLSDHPGNSIREEFRQRSAPQVKK